MMAASLAALKNLAYRTPALLTPPKRRDRAITRRSLALRTSPPTALPHAKSTPSTLPALALRMPRAAHCLARSSAKACVEASAASLSGGDY